MIALLALFLACGGVAAALPTIDGSTIIVRSIPANRLVPHTVTAHQMHLAPEQVVGAPGEPAFGSGWSSESGGFEPIGFYRDDEAVVHLRGVLALGGHSATIFTLPTGYRPAATEMFGATLDSGGTAVLFITAAGEVDLEYISSPTTPHYMTFSQISFRAGV
jgi:hypothetical protein